MANFDTIKAAIDANINTNGKQEITGGKMNSILHQMVDATGEQLAELESNVESNIGDYEFEGSVAASTADLKYILLGDSYSFTVNSRICIEVLSFTDNVNGEGWRIEYKIDGVSYYLNPSVSTKVIPEGIVSCILAWHKPGYGAGTIRFRLKSNLSFAPIAVQESLLNTIRNESAFNVNSLFPNDTSKEFTLETAIAAVPENYRKIAKLISYRTKDGVEIAAFNSIYYLTGFTDVENWNIVSSGRHDVRYQKNRTIYITDNLLDSASLTFGDGWSGNLEEGFTHTKGKGDNLVISSSLSWGYYMVKVTLLSGTLALDDGLRVKVGASNYLDVYNGSEEMWCYYGGKGATNASTIILKPSSLIDFKVKIEVFRIATKDSASQKIKLSPKSITHGQMAWDNSGFWNIALGGKALELSQNGTRNIALGHASLCNFIGGARNISIGTFSSSLLRSGDRNIAIGSDSLYMLKNASDVISIGKASFGQGSAEGQTEAHRSVAIGTDTFKGQHPASVIKESVAVGYKAGYNSGSRNVCLGAFSNTFNQDVTNSVVVGYAQQASESNEVRIGNRETRVTVLGNRLLRFNADGSVTWEYSTSKARYTGTALSNDTTSQYLSFDGDTKLYIWNQITIVANSVTNSGDENGWILVVKPKGSESIYTGIGVGKEMTWDSEIEYIQVYHKAGTGSGSIDFHVITSN